VNPAFDPASVRALLRRGIANGWWTLQDLDVPSYGFRENLKVDRRLFPHGYTGIQHCNLLRDSPPIPKPTPEASSSPNKATEPPAPVPTTQDPVSWSF
jgi:hypothetical protein